jgi:hypothetical protein
LQRIALVIVVGYILHKENCFHILIYLDFDIIQCLLLYNYEILLLVFSLVYI